MMKKEKKRGRPKKGMGPVEVVRELIAGENEKVAENSKPCPQNIVPDFNKYLEILKEEGKIVY